MAPLVFMYLPNIRYRAYVFHYAIIIIREIYFSSCNLSRFPNKTYSFFFKDNLIDIYKDVLSISVFSTQSDVL